MADQKDKNPDESLEQTVGDLMRKGASQEQIAEIVQAHDDMLHPWKAMAGGATEGLGEGVMTAITAPFTSVVDAVSDIATMLNGEGIDNTHLMQAADAIIKTPETWEKAGPRERAKMVTSILTSVVGGAATAKALSSEAVMGNTGRGLEYLGTRKNAVPFAVGSGMLAGAASGDLSRVAEGAMAGLLPPAMVRIGRGMQRLAGKATMKEEGDAQRAFKGAMNRKDTLFRADQAERRAAESEMRSEIASETKKLDKEQAAAREAEDNAKKAEAIKANREGMEPGPKRFTESSSATDPETGRRVTESQSFREPGEGGGANEFGPGYTPDEVAFMRANRITPDMLKGGAAPAVTGGPSRPAIRVGGKAAQDLQNGVTPPRPVNAPAGVVADIARKVGSGAGSEAAAADAALAAENASRAQGGVRVGGGPGERQRFYTPGGPAGETEEQWRARMQAQIDKGSTPAAPKAEPKTQIPKDYREVKEGEVFQPGREFIMDTQTGKRYVKEPRFVKEKPVKPVKADKPTEAKPAGTPEPTASKSKDASSVGGSPHWTDRDYDSYMQVRNDHPDWDGQQVIKEVERQRDARAAAYKSGELKKEN